MVLRNRELLVVLRTVRPEHLFFNLLLSTWSCAFERGAGHGACSCNTKLIRPPQVLEATFDKMKPRVDLPNRNGELAWPALLRKLDRIDPFPMPELISGPVVGRSARRVVRTAPFQSLPQIAMIGLGTAHDKRADHRRQYHRLPPPSRRDLISGISDIQWVDDHVLLCWPKYASLLLTLGRIGDTIGHAIVYQLGLVLCSAVAFRCSSAMHRATAPCWRFAACR